ncbi:MAG: FAD:protein FMN transferase [Pseudomonadales bacterium]|nr:FAD:protein FMN transferase [Pseudomonadales bacterium]
MPCAAAWHEDTRAIMGTRVHVEFWLDDADSRGPALLERCMNEMWRIDHAFSPMRDDSELSRLNRDAGRDWVEVSDELMDLLQRSRAASERSGGAFDITFASVGRYYDYRQGRLPTPEEKKAVAAINYRFVELDGVKRQARFADPRVYVDLGGIAKGWAVDRVIGILQAARVRTASVSAGGDSRILGDRLGQPWTVGVRDPRKADGVAVLLPLVDTAVSTSGDYERFFEKDGVRYHHILDPKTGDSARGAMSVTIIGPDATLTDSLSTTVFVLGADKGLALIDTLPGIDAIVITPAGELRYSRSLEPLSGHRESSTRE